MWTFLILIIIFLVVFCLIEDGVIGRNSLTDADKATPGATITEIEPKVFGFKNSSHYELIVKFSDGTTYRGKCGNEEVGILTIRISVDREHSLKVVQDAIAAHDKAVSKNTHQDINTSNSSDSRVENIKEITQIFSADNVEDIIAEHYKYQLAKANTAMYAYNAQKELLPAIVYVCIIASKDRGNHQADIFEHASHGIILMDRNINLDWFNKRITLYKEIYGGHPFRGEFLLPNEIEPWKKAPVGAVVAALGDILCNPKCRENYDNAQRVDIVNRTGAENFRNYMNTVKNDMERLYQDIINVKL